jgi:signal transduction histidine kinase
MSIDPSIQAVSLSSSGACTVSSATTQSDPDLRMVKVLVAEAIDVDAQVIQSHLASCPGHFMVVRIRSLAELRPAFERCKYDLVILGLELRDVWGLDALRQARGWLGDTPIVALTAVDDRKLGLACIEAGAEDFVTKAELAPGLLDRAIRHAISRKRARDIDTWLEHSNRLTALGTLAASIAHEVSNPVTTAAVNAGLVQEELSSLVLTAPPGAARLALEESLAAQREVVESLDRIRAAMRNVQSFARPQAEVHELIDVADICRRARRIVSGELKERARYRERLTSGVVLGDARQLEQVIVNLLINAAHAIAPGAPVNNVIAVETELRPDAVIIRVSDSGSGIAPEVLGRVFEPFFTTKSRERGSGLGLWICSRIVARMGGQILVSTELGVGTRFDVILPRVEGAPSRSSTGDLAPHL